jgi:hypothetical protein
MKLASKYNHMSTHESPPDTLTTPEDPYAWMLDPKYAGVTDSNTHHIDPADSRGMLRAFLEAEPPVDGVYSVVGPNGSAIQMTTELYDRIQERGAPIVWRQLHDEIEHILTEPFGETSVDALKDKPEGRWVRLVHEVTGPLADLVPGTKLALKGTGLQLETSRRNASLFGEAVERLSPSEQFGPSLEAWRRQQERAPDGIYGCLFINKPYGVLTYTDRTGATAEWLLMELIEDAQTMEQTMTWGGGGLIFDNAKYPEMAALAAAATPNGDDQGGTMGATPFSSLGAAIAHELGYDNPFRDVDGPNMLVQEINGRRVYTAIDILSHTMLL